MVGHLIKIDRPDQVDRAHQLFLDVPGEVAGVEELELAEENRIARLRALSDGSTGRSGGAIAQRIGGADRRRSRATDRLRRRVDHLASRGQDQPFSPFERQRIAGFQALPLARAGRAIGYAQWISRGWARRESPRRASRSSGKPRSQNCPIRTILSPAPPRRR